MNYEKLPGKVRGLAQAAEIIGGTLISLGYILTHPDEVAPEGGWRKYEVVSATGIRGRLRLRPIIDKGINLVMTSVRKSSRR